MSADHVAEIARLRRIIKRVVEADDAWVTVNKADDNYQAVLDQWNAAWAEAQAEANRD